MNPYPYLQNKFWEKRAEFIISSVQADIYYCLLMLFNKAFWPKKFTRTNESMANLIGISKNTFKKGRTKLVEIGLIQYYGENPTTYILPDLEIFRSSLSKKEVSKIDTQTDREIDTCNDERSESGSGARSVPRSVKVSKIDPIIRHNTNTKTNTVNNKDSSISKKEASLLLPLEERKKIFIEKVLAFTDKYEKFELEKFIRFWGEHNEGGKKMKFEMQKTFSISQRLVTWEENRKKYETKNKQNNATSKNSKHTTENVKSMFAKIDAMYNPK